MDGVHHLGPAGDAASGSPPAMPLAVVIRSGTTPSAGQANTVTGAPEAGLDLVGHEQHAVRRHHAASARRNPGRRDDEAALALDRLDHHAGGLRRPDLLLDHVDRPRRGGLAGHPGVAQRVRHRRAVDLAGNGPKPCLYGIDLDVIAIVRFVRPW